MATLDLEQELAPMGGRVKSLNPDGTVSVSLTNPQTGDSVNRNIDMIGLMKLKGLDPLKTDVKFNSPERAAEGADLSFSTKLALSLAGDEKSKTQYLKDQFGADNVLDTKQGPVVKEAGVWKKADSSLLSDVASSSPEVVAGMAGRIAGGAVGTLLDPVLGPAGTIGGAWAGGAAASALARYLKDKGSVAAGIKSEYDANQAVQTMKTDFGINLALDAAFGGVASVVKGEVLPLLKGASKIPASAAAKAMTTVAGEDKAAIADMAHALVGGGTTPEDWRVLTRSPEDAKNIMNDIKAVHEWKNMPEGVRPDASPVQTQMADVAETAMRGARANSARTNADVIEQISNHVNLDNANTSIAKAGADFKSTLANLGILDVSQDGVASIAKKPSQDGARIMQVFDPKSISTLNKVLGQVTSVMTPLSEDGARVAERKLSFNESKQLLNGVDDILESSGYYKGSEMAVSNNARAALRQLRSDVNQSMVGGLAEQSPSAAKAYKDEAARSHAFLNLYEDFALPSKLGGSDQKTVSTVMRMFGGTQDLDKADFRQMMKAAGVDGDAYVSRLEQLNAANNLHPTWSGDGLLNKGKSLIGLNPASMSMALGQQTLKAGQDAVAQATPVSSFSKQSAEAWARGLDYLNSLKPLDRANLVGNPVVLRQMLLSITGANSQ